MKWKIFIRLCLCPVILCGFGTGTALGAIVSPLNGTEAIDAHGMQDLKVHNPDHDKQALKIEKAEHFVIVQGDPDTRRTVNVLSSRSPQHHVADVDIPEAGELLYHVRGVILREGEGGSAPPPWTAGYNRGDARIVLEINEYGAHDDIVALGNNGAALRIWILGATGIVPVRLTASPAGRLSNIPTPDAEPFHVDVIAGARPTSGSLNGLGAGQVTITASATVDNQEVSATITGSVLVFRGTVLPDVRFIGRSFTG